MYFEAALAEERCGNLQRARYAFAQSSHHCPDNLRWKVWLSGARMELRAGRDDVARNLLRYLGFFVSVSRALCHVT